MSTDCHYCGRPTFTSYPPSKAPPHGFSPQQLRTKDHMLPKSCGGGRAGNIVIACVRCNVAKSADEYEDFKPFASTVLRNLYPRADASTARAMFRVWMVSKVMNGGVE